MRNFFSPTVKEPVCRVRTAKTAPVVGFCLLALTACGPGAVNLQPAPNATDPGCAYAMVAMPEQLDTHRQRETTAQATTAWGDPAVAILKCGVEVQEPVSDPCTSVNGIDWILRPAADNEQAGESAQTATGTWTATTFGRSPALQVTFEADRISSSTLLAELGSAVQQLEQTKECSAVGSSLDIA